MKSGIRRIVPAFLLATLLASVLGVGVLQLVSAKMPPSGTETTASHNTMLMIEAAADIDQPRSTSIVGPKLKIIAKPTL